MGYPQQLAELATSTTQRLESSDGQFQPTDFQVETAYLGAGYGIVGELEHSAISFVAQTEGILRDLVYTGRAMGGLLD